MVCLFLQICRAYGAGESGLKLFRPQQKDGDADAVLDAAGGGAEKYVADETMPMRAHGHEVATFLLHPFHDFGDGGAESQLRFGGNIQGLKYAVSSAISRLTASAP